MPQSTGIDQNKPPLKQARHSHTFKPRRQHRFDVLRVDRREPHSAQHSDHEVRPQVVDEGLLVGEETVLVDGGQLGSKHVDAEGPFDRKLNRYGLAAVLVAEFRIRLSIVRGSDSSAECGKL